MASETDLLRRMYDCFNARDIDGVLAMLSEDVVWANGMDGGHVHGRDAVREYWTRQWTIVNSHVEPVGFDTGVEGSVVVRVQQSVRDLENKPLKDHAHGLKDKTVDHVFRLRNSKVTRFDIQDDLSATVRSPS